MPELGPEYPEVRFLIARGALVRAVAIYGVLREANSIELIGLELDTSWD